jgi:hypothetical protein
MDIYLVRERIGRLLGFATVRLTRTRVVGVMASRAVPPLTLLHGAQLSRQLSTDSIGGSSTQLRLRFPK